MSTHAGADWSDRGKGGQTCNVRLKLFHSELFLEERDDLSAAAAERQTANVATDSERCFVGEGIQ